jgi:hypothetical protein
MIEDAHLDGNAVGGLLAEMLGSDMTDHRGCCGECGAVSVMATVIVYRRAPGEVLRCPACGAVLMVIVPHPSGARLHLRALDWIGH